MAKQPDPAKTAEHQKAHADRIEKLRENTKSQQEANKKAGR